MGAILWFSLSQQISTYTRAHACVCMHTHIHITDCPPWKHRSCQKKKPPTFGPGDSACGWLQVRRQTSHPPEAPGCNHLEKLPALWSRAPAPVAREIGSLFSYCTHYFNIPLLNFSPVLQPNSTFHRKDM
uniref:Uncharacterized protein n=1 Tax=Myotis myotis TaxID=51298 RepID=A0A7J7RFN3_MYOMY|nr:hypothetical protein mMyoMyo1_010340 [Myotis myotis]